MLVTLALLLDGAFELVVTTIGSVVVAREDASVFRKRQDSLDRVPQSRRRATWEIASSSTHVWHEDLIDAITARTWSGQADKQPEIRLHGVVIDRERERERERLLTYSITNKDTIVDEIVRAACRSVTRSIQYTAGEVSDGKLLVVLPQHVELRAIERHIREVEHGGHDLLHSGNVLTDSNRSTELLFQQHSATDMICNEPQRNVTNPINQSVSQSTNQYNV
jgi:hypothetical protein